MAKDADGIRKRCETLNGYVREGWEVLEPGRAYVHGWHLDCMAEHLEAITAGQINRLLINVPPGMMKSLEVGVFWPTWEWGPKKRPSLRTLAASYRELLAKRDNIKSRRLILSEWYQALWGDQFQLMGDQNATLKFENTKTGFRQAMAFGSMTGERGDRVILDDPLSVKQAKSEAELLAAKETFLEAIPSRVSDPETSAIVVVMQRLNEGDTTGVALSKELGYTHVMLPMEFERERRCYTVVKPKHFNAGKPIRARYDSGKQSWYEEGKPIPPHRLAYVEKVKVQTVYNQDPRTKDGELLFPARFPKEVVERDKVPLGSVGHAGQNQQRPSPREGGMFKRAWFRIVRSIPVGTRFARGWDLAATDDDPTAARTAGVKIGKQPNGRYLVAHCVAEHASPARLRTLMLNTASQDGQGCKIAFPQDPGAAGKVQKSDLVGMLAGYNARAKPVTGDKITRAEPFSAQAEAGNVDILEGPWNEEYLDELCLFPNGKLKDIADASAEAFNALLTPDPPSALQGTQSRG